MRALLIREFNMPLTQKQRRHLKGLVHHLKPVVMIGQHGITDSLLAELDAALLAHELIKIRISGAERDERRQAVEQLCQSSGAELIHTIGHTAALYRRHPKHPKIALPSD